MSDIPITTAFESATVILPVMNETGSLAKSVEMILQSSRRDLREFLIVVCDKTTSDSMELVTKLENNLGRLVVVHHQKLPFLGGAIREAFDLATGSHVIMMASDLETNPADVALLISEARKAPHAIITASRWIKGGAFHQYSRIKLMANWLFQKLFSLLYSTDLTDMTYGYRIFPTSLVQRINWEELRHPFLFETLVKPLRLGVPIVEVPSVWRARSDGESQNTFWRNFAYFRTGLRTRFASRKDILRTRPVLHQL